ncbi:unnamed protein product [Trichogramma brassicae]|uniref:Integrator complex subunit 5 N-terminal domain-containing protein n=1 Tax=Trichogramma brassicae TaxID=86971 RepID=A0A6H5J3X4_9HYME|nr:unnamed protein product [Trichogramma brassicae]
MKELLNQDVQNSILSYLYSMDMFQQVEMKKQVIFVMEESIMEIYKILSKFINENPKAWSSMISSWAFDLLVDSEMILRLFSRFENWKIQYNHMLLNRIGILTISIKSWAHDVCVTAVLSSVNWRQITNFLIIYSIFYFLRSEWAYVKCRALPPSWMKTSAASDPNNSFRLKLKLTQNLKLSEPLLVLATCVVSSKIVNWFWKKKKNDVQVYIAFSMRRERHLSDYSGELLLMSLCERHLCPSSL